MELHNRIDTVSNQISYADADLKTPKGKEGQRFLDVALQRQRKKFDLRIYLYPRRTIKQLKNINNKNKNPKNLPCFNKHGI